MAESDEKRQWALVALALRNGVDSDDVEAAYAAQGIDPDTADLRVIDKAVKEAYGPPAPSSWLP